MNNKKCLVCDKDFIVPDSRVKTAKYCSRACSDSRPFKKNKVNCAECGASFPLKKSQADRNKVWGSFCSDICSSSFRSRMTSGDKNPNSRQRQYDSDGYRLYVPHGKGEIKLHRYTAKIALGLSELPK